MLLCVSATLTAILAVEPPSDRPPVQRPKSTEVIEGPKPPAEGNPPLFIDEGAPQPDTSDPPNPAVPDPETTQPPATQPESPEPESPEPEIANLLTSEDPDTDDDRPLVASPRPVDTERVDRSEWLRSYYAKIYRPADNPGRVWFAARGSYSLTSSSQSVGGGRMGVAAVEAGQTWNWLGYGLGLTVMGGGLTFGDNGISKSSSVLVGGGPSLGLGRLALVGRGYVDFRVGYNFFYAPVKSRLAGLADPADASPHGPKAQLDIGLLLHDTESRRFRHGLGVTIGWQMLVHSFSGEYPRLNSFNAGFGYFFG